MNGIVEQLVEEMKDIPKLKWKDARIEPPDTTKILLVMDFTEAWDDWDRTYETDEELKTVCGFTVVEYSNAYEMWHDMINYEDVIFDWYIEINILPPKYKFVNGLAVMSKEFKELLYKNEGLIEEEVEK